MTIAPWNQRPFIVANLFNPAFCALLLFDSVEQYSKKNNDLGMPYSLLYFILPIVLHKNTRDSLPKSTIKILHLWIQANPYIRIGFAQRAREFVPFTKEALIFGTSNGLFTINNGNIIPGRIEEKSIHWDNDSEVAQCRKIAQFLGRWFSQTEDLSMIFIMFGVQP